jgi:glucose dehydrogenase
VADTAWRHRSAARRSTEYRASGPRRRDRDCSGLLFIASTDDNHFRAFEARTGKELWVTTLERRGNANPLTYQSAGKQYVAIVATDRLVAYALP